MVCDNDRVIAGQVPPWLKVEPREPRDLPECVELLRSVHVADSYPKFWPPDPARWIATKREVPAWVVRDDSSTIQGHVGVQGVKPGPAADLWTAASGTDPELLLEVNRLFVSPAHRRQRLGEALLAEVVRYAHEQGAQPVLEVSQQGAAAIRLYERLGWRRVGEWELTVDEQRRLPLFLYLGPAVGSML